VANNTSAGTPTEVKKQPGFEGWAAIVGLMGVVYLFRRKNEGV
jgi:PGF-CTERM protein